MLQGGNTLARNFISTATVFLERHRVQKLANLYLCGLCYEVIKHNQYKLLHKFKLNMDKELKIDTAQRLEQLLQALVSACAC